LKSENNRLRVIRESSMTINGRGRRIVVAICLCLNVKEYLGYNIENGNSKSCGCLNEEKRFERKYKHGLVDTPEYQAWQNMKDRCYNIRNRYYENYGGRGITVYELWIRSFGAFISYVGMRPSGKHLLERMNNDGNYEPGNVRWATRKEQNNNKRSNRLATYDGRTKTVAQWSEILGKPATTITSRLNTGRDIVTGKRATMPRWAA
jgi:hypothetical protein